MSAKGKFRKDVKNVILMLGTRARTLSDCRGQPVVGKEKNELDKWWSKRGKHDKQNGPEFFLEEVERESKETSSMLKMRM